MNRSGMIMLAAAAAGIAIAGPALADVRSGVEAWSAGDFTKAVAEWRGPAAKDDPDALFNLAQAYRLGRGVPEDLKQAETLYARAAAKGHIKAADNYGLLLFQDGRREAAMPYVDAAAERGDPRAQYLLGIAHFNGDLVPKDWVRAYSLLTLANAAGLPQASAAIRQMDGFIPLAQRQQAQTLAATLRGSADARRTSQLAAEDLDRGSAPPPPALVAAAPPVARVAVLPPSVQPPARLPQPLSSVAVPPSIAAAEAAVAEAMRATGTESPANAGADRGADSGTTGIRPARDIAAVAATPVRARTAVPAPASSAPAETAKTAGGGLWKLQLGAFSVAGNADRLWRQLAGTAPLAGKSRQTLPAGRLTRLLAAGWPSEAAAQAACSALRGGGQTCLVTR